MEPKIELAGRGSAAILALLALFGLTLQYWDVVATGRAGPEPLAVVQHLSKYFTHWGSAILALVMAWVLIRGRIGAGWAGGVTLWVLIVGVVYHLLLKGGPIDAVYGRWADLLLHSVVPAMAAIWWLTYAPKAGLRWGHAMLWLALPLVFCLVALARGQVSGEYPYFFIDPTKGGWGPVAQWVAILLVAFWLGGALLVGLGRLFPGRPQAEATS